MYDIMQKYHDVLTLYPVMLYSVVLYHMILMKKLMWYNIFYSLLILHYPYNMILFYMIKFWRISYWIILMIQHSTIYMIFYDFMWVVFLSYHIIVIEWNIIQYACNMKITKWFSIRWFFFLNMNVSQEFTKTIFITHDQILTEHWIAS